MTQPQQYPAQPQQYPAAPPPQGVPFVQCRLCGSVPAVEGTFRGHQGFIVMMRFLSLRGPFCRDCGLATFRRMTSNTLALGWWGLLSFCITPIVVLLNLVERAAVARLGAPMPSPYGNSRPPMDPGAPLLARPMTIIGLSLPLLAFVVIIAVQVASNG